MLAKLTNRVRFLHMPTSPTALAELGQNWPALVEFCGTSALGATMLSHEGRCDWHSASLGSDLQRRPDVIADGGGQEWRGGWLRSTSDYGWASLAPLSNDVVAMLVR